MIDDIFAALMFFTRLPWWKLRRVPADSFKRIVGYWPVAGWVTGGVMTAIYGIALFFHLPVVLAILLVFTGRLLLTGALHEDGLADFFDGFGGGRSREQVLTIMKDSHIGTYGVLALVVYVALWVTSTVSLAQRSANLPIVLLLFADVWSKWSASQIVNLLPYARNEEDCKIKKVYDRMSARTFTVGLLFALVPMLGCVLFLKETPYMALWICVTASVPNSVMVWLVQYMRRRIGGYTGDCCGATFLLCELSYFITLNTIWIFI
ncbi:adenosylcobinamide-GDP ribazoletransferase [Tannerella forsythia]|uniref:Adenosylcobinamide-GDP ribazoletransferase n=2 Tax=Tannerella forsythia TaxID=28112 RepID=G8UPG6_TANFA|nr:adenosylcobinamide-GDP ribazoletransferase [Tannerella forsythia]AEW21080.1 cobalamin-5-phosphate synthase [Tannerella forsythia 92A2]OLQ21752.1 cobalamin 5'-phosphate synthase [Tannerella forsythia]PDP70331.1 adenosylcobinamide-GDP ribazoletransferase [Tannerella forsythia]SCQ19953.1 Adenosylcobinamide-GDP ribazoletransferase [Tannerella forsythia]SCQ19980.1 Adenosylcobinamide-GDP ribazoletransferase [Tannerella forsythia]